VSSPFWIAGEDKTKPKRAPAIGQHRTTSASCVPMAW
jgi:hypothetical protein